jgi:hypothetical protein
MIKTKEGPVPCHYCDNSALLVSGKVVHIHNQDLWNKMFWYCNGGHTPHNPAYVGTHSDNRPLGTLADMETRKWRLQAHNFFDILWEHNHVGRTEAYRWLADEMNMTKDECHMGMMDAEQCKEVVRCIPAIKKKIKSRNEKRRQDTEQEVMYLSNPARRRI